MMKTSHSHNWPPFIRSAASCKEFEKVERRWIARLRRRWERLGSPARSKERGEEVNCKAWGGGMHEVLWGGEGVGVEGEGDRSWCVSWWLAQFCWIHNTEEWRLLTIYIDHTARPMLNFFSCKEYDVTFTLSFSSKPNNNNHTFQLFGSPWFQIGMLVCRKQKIYILMFARTWGYISLVQWLF